MPEGPPVYASVAELIEGATERTGLDGETGKSGARLERLVIAGRAVRAQAP